MAEIWLKEDWLAAGRVQGGERRGENGGGHDWFSDLGFILDLSLFVCLSVCLSVCVRARGPVCL